MAGTSSIARLRGGLVVSCQANEGEPLCSPSHIKALALSVITGGACGLRLEGRENVKAIRDATRLPIIGLSKTKGLTENERLDNVYITATFPEAQGLAEAGADIIAIDATTRLRAGNEQLGELIAKIKGELNVLVMADISRLDEAMNAEALGADLISTTLFGYTAQTVNNAESGPALDLLADIVRHVRVPVILEGRVWHPQEVTAAFAQGAFAVVVGSAITRPQLITKRFVRAIPSTAIEANAPPEKKNW